MYLSSISGYLLMVKIIHVDMDCFYAAVEMRDNPLLADKPIAVGGDSERRGVISTCNYLAREFGVRSAMATAKAKQLCPNLVLVPGRMGVYRQVSTQIREIFYRYSSLVEPLSLDEAYIDVSDCELCHGSATLIAAQIRQQIFETTGLTASAGVAPNKFMAKIASDLNKPNGQYVITPGKVDEFAMNLPLNKIPGVGAVTQKKLKRLGLTIGRDVRAVERDFMIKHFGKLGVAIRERCFGIDPRGVDPTRVRKSVGVEITLVTDLETQEQCVVILEQLFPELLKRIEKADAASSIAKQGIKIKFNDFQATTVEKVSHEANYPLYLSLLGQALSRSNGRKIRLIGLNVGLSTEQQSSHQLDLF